LVLLLWELMASSACSFLLSFSSHGFKRLEKTLICNLSYNHATFAGEDGRAPHHHQGRYG